MDFHRPARLSVATTSVRLPCLFPSISSVKTNMQPVQYLEFLVASGHTQFLVSAYDIARACPEDQSRFADLLSRAAGSDQTILMDSGNYEAFWKADVSWDVPAFHDVLKRSTPHLYFCYDNQTPPDSAAAIAADVMASQIRDQAVSAATLIPIVHGQAALLPDAVGRLARHSRPSMVAVPERALGDGILTRAATVRAIRSALSSAAYYVPLHLLGTGNPLSLLIYALAGADSFDGLEWCQTVVDHRSGRLHHFQLYDLFADQTPFVHRVGLPYIQSVLLHNLAFFTQFMTDLADACVRGEERAFALKWLWADEYGKVSAILE